jgi:hypothetical protein
MPLTPATEAIIDKAPISRRLILKPDARGRLGFSPAPARGQRVRHGVRHARELRFNDLRGTKVTETVVGGDRSARSRHPYWLEGRERREDRRRLCRVNPGRATVLALAGPAREDDVAS